MNTAGTDILTRLSPPTAKRAAAQVVQRAICGVKSVDAPHPAVLDLEVLPADARSLRGLIEAIDPAVAAGSKHFTRSQVLGDVVGPALVAATGQHPIPPHRFFCRMVPAPDFREFRIVADLEGFALTLRLEGAETEECRLSKVRYEPAQVYTYAGLVQVSKEDLASDRDLQLFARTADALIAAAYRHEAAAVFGKLTSDPDLADGEPWFDATNSIAAADLTWYQVDRMAELLASQTDASGEFAALTPRVLVLPASAEACKNLSLDAMTGPLAMTLAAPRIEVIRSPHLTTTAFMLADPAVQPALALATMNPRPSVDVNNRLPLHLVSVGAEMSVDHSYAVAPLSRRGIVRFTVAD